MKFLIVTIFLVFITSCNALQKHKTLIVPIATEISKEVVKDIFDIDVDTSENEVKAEKQVLYSELEKVFGEGVKRLTNEGGNTFFTKKILINLNWQYQPDTKTVLLRLFIKKFE